MYITIIGSAPWIVYHLCGCEHSHKHTAVLQYAGYYNSSAGFCEGGVITVIKVAVGGNPVLLEEHGNPMEKQALSLTGVKLCKYINTPWSPTYFTPVKMAAY